jgi:hypothetical protein
MYYQRDFLDAKWAEYKKLNRIKDDDDVDPDGFAVWGFEQLLLHRIPLYEKIANRYGYTARMEDVPTIASEEGFVALLASLIDRRS